MRTCYKLRISILILRGISKLKLKIENRIRIERNIRILRLKNRFIDKIETIFVCDIVFKRDIKQNELDVKDFFHHNKLNVILL